MNKGGFMGPNEPRNTTPSVEPKQQPVASVESPVPASQEPVSGTFTEQATPVPQLPLKKSKKGLIIGLVSAGVLIVGLAVAGIVYATVYNSPENVVMDAFSKALAAKSGTMTGSVSMKTQDTSVKLDLTSAANEAGQGSADVTVTVTAEGKEYNLKGHFASTKDEIYVKLDDLQSIIEGALGAEYAEMIDSYYGTLLDKIDSKWVVIKQSDIEELSSNSVSNKESECVQTEVAKLKTDASLRNELTAVYKKNPLFTIESKGSDSDGNHYSLTPVGNDGTKKFLNALVDTKVFKAVDDCTSSDLKKEVTADSSGSSTEKSTGTLELWIDGWSHTLNKISLNMKSDSAELTSEFKTKFNNNPSVTIPKGETTVDDLKSEIENIQQQLTSSYDMSDMTDYDYSY